MGDRGVRARAPDLRLHLASFVHGAHIAVIAFFLLGWALPCRGALWTVVYGAVLTQLNWWAFRNRCALTLAEEWLRHGGAPDPSRRDDNFVARFLTSLTGRPCPDWLAHVAAYVVLWASLAISVCRLRGWPHGP